MSTKTFKPARTPEELRKRDLGRIHKLKKAVMEKQQGFSDENYRDLIHQVKPGCESSADLDQRGRWDLIKRLSALAGEEVPQYQGGWKKKSYPNRPKNMDQPGESRADQLGKIEALLTIGGFSWSYADGIARQMRLADKVQWVKPEDLFKIITALTKKAQKEGWDLSRAR